MRYLLPILAATALAGCAVAPPECHTINGALVCHPGYVAAIGPAAPIDAVDPYNRNLTSQGYVPPGYAPAYPPPPPPPTSQVYSAPAYPTELR